MFPELLSRCAAVTPEQAAILERHYELLVRWNRKLNLTTIDRLADAIDRHYCESLFLASRLPAGFLRVADVGSGAGFPGLPVAVMRPDCGVTLIESHQRKAVFLREASRDLPNVSILAKRCESVEDRFDWLISRAVSYADLALCRLAPNVALLTGAEVPPVSLDFQWREAVALPNSRSRYLRIGSRAT